MQMIWSTRTSDFDKSQRAQALTLMVVLGLRQLDLLTLIMASRPESGVHGLTLISEMIRLEDGALSQTLISRMIDLLYFCTLQQTASSDCTLIHSIYLLYFDCILKLFQTDFSFLSEMMNFDFQFFLVIMPIRISYFRSEIQ